MVVFVDSFSQGDAWNKAVASLHPGAQCTLVSIGSKPTSEQKEQIVLVEEVSAVKSAYALLQLGILCGLKSGALYFYWLHNLKSEMNVHLLLPDSCLEYQSTLLNASYLLENEVVAPAHHKYRGAVIEDLQLPEATTVFTNETLKTAQTLMLQRNFSQCPVVNALRRVVGLISLDLVQGREDHLLVQDVMFKFPKGSKYQVVTLGTPLVELDPLFERTRAVFVTDEQGKFPLGVVTKADVLKFLSKLGTN